MISRAGILGMTRPRGAFCALPDTLSRG